MTTFKTEFDNSYVTIHNKEIDIHYRKKNVRMALDKVAKIYLKKKKSKYSTWFPGIKLFSDPEYNLCIKTSDNKEIRFEVKANERQYFIGPIAMVRSLNKHNELTAAS